MSKSYGNTIPLLIKCSGGGGGHGMRVVQNASELIMALKLTRAEGKKAFGNDTVYMERALRKPRHIEVQLFGYGDGKVAHLFTRACSVQRRYQKIIEEAPAPMVTAAKLRQMEQDAIKLAASLNYRGAGTAEFLLDEDGQHYFLEMNTRLQVEHAVTEMILGIDLVALQIQLAAGVDLSAPLLRLQDQQKTIHPRGHAIECRIYAENPLQNFAPAPGNIVHLRLPQGPNVRVDSGIYAGFQVPVFYDAMIAKFITWGPDRDTARRRMLRAIDETVITGITTNLQFLKQALQCNSFIRGDYSTKIIDDEKLLSKLADSSKQSDPHVLTAAAASYLEIQSQSNTPRDGEQLSAWQTK
jgi:acetyl-CoA carboxylase biotin carboxylase subunit